MRAVHGNTLYEWTVREFNALCRKHDLPLHGNKLELYKTVKTHFQELYMN